MERQRITAAGRRKYRALDRSDRMERMMTEIGTGVAMDDSVAVIDDVDRANWRRLSAQMAAIGEAGGTVVYDYGADEDV